MDSPSSCRVTPEVEKPHKLVPEFRRGEVWYYFGPAFVASVAYIDPGNFATNIEGGTRFGYQLMWVLLWSNAMAILVQYMAAKLGIATGHSLPENCREHFSRATTYVLWIAAELSAIATDLAEFLGAALGFYLLFHLNMMASGLLTAVIVFILLAVELYGYRRLEQVIMGFVAVIGICYFIETTLARPRFGPVLYNAIVPHLSASSVYVAVSMLGATVMPHVIYLHSALVKSRSQESEDRCPPAHFLHKLRHARYELIDVLVAMNGAFLINAAMLVMAAAVFFAHGQTVTGIEDAHKTLRPLLGNLSAAAFGLALLFSGLSSSAVGTMAGQVIIEGFLKVKFPIFLRRLITVIPALVVIALKMDALKVLVLSQVILSFGLPFALIPLIILTRRGDIMCDLTNNRLTNQLAYLSTAIILGLNGWLIYAAFTGQG
jgi:manganese transport protein